MDILNHLTFTGPEHDLTTAIHGNYDYQLVLVSVLVAILASYTAFLVAERVRQATSKPFRLGWCTAGAISLGLGVWSMHFIGMLAYELPVSIEYDIATTIISVIPAMYASLVVLRSKPSQERYLQQLTLQSVLMGGGIGLMHYLGMAAMRMDATMRYDLGLFLLSIIIAILLAGLSLRVKQWANQRDKPNTLFSSSLMFSAVIMGCAISGMHYTGMAAMYVFPGDEHQHNLAGMALSTYTLTEIIVVTTMLISILMIGSMMLVHRYRLYQKIIRSESRQRTILATVADGIITIDREGIIKTFNPAAEGIFGYQANEAIGQDISLLLQPGQRSAHMMYTRESEKHAPQIVHRSRELVGCKKDGSTFPMELHVTPMQLEEGEGYVGVLRDITERKRIDEIKNEFISTVSHELRTPLTSIRGSLGLITGGAVGELTDQTREMLKIASNNTERLLLLINDILDIQKIEAGKVSFKFQRIELMPFMERVVEDNAGYGDQHNVTFEIKERLEGATLFADPVRLMQVMSNLLSNAAKFSPDGDVVEINLAYHRDAIRISVTDHGAGIPEEFQSQLFEKFSQADSADNRKVGGTGLGLPITKTLVEKHGGHISFLSREGMGTTFFVDLPELTGEVSEYEVEHPNQVLEKYSACILIIEDDQDVASLLNRTLSQKGYNCDIAHNTQQAREMLKERRNQYKLITLDLILPAEDGILFLKELRNSPDTKAMPVVVISVKADEGKRDLDGGAIGVVDWIQKPIDEERLIEAIQQAAKRNARPKVLHVEDEQDVHQVVFGLLKEHCFLDWATTLEQAKKATMANQYDLILLDAGLPDGSGLELLEVIEQQENPPQVVIFSALDIEQKYADKASAVLLKSRTENERLVRIITDLIPQDELSKRESS